MREYTQGKEAAVKKIICNQCGKELNMRKDLLMEECVSVNQIWGYFSRKDGENHSFDLCEDCYDKLVKGFVLPVTVEKRKELL